MVSLGSLKNGEVGIVKEITGGQDFLSRIAATGFIRETEVTMLRNWKRGPVIVFLRDTQLALGRDEASKIMIRRREI